MTELIKARWMPRPESGLSRRDQRGCNYEAYAPDPLMLSDWRLDGDVAADVADAERALVRLDATARALVSSEALARLLLRAEAVASSRIEGLRVGGRRLLRAQASAELGEASSDVTATEILSNIDAVTWATQQVRGGDPITIDTLLATHARLLAETALDAHAGRVRTEQNWIGGSSFNPCSAAFVPPPPERLPDLLRDLISFANTDDLPAVAQAAIAHAQFETIHPFADGNGRTGRALIHLVLRRRGHCQNVLAPVSLILATRADDYVAGLTATRTEPDATLQQINDGWNQWIGAFAAAIVRAVDDAGAFQATVEKIQDAWIARLPRLRAGSAAQLLVDRLPAAPVVSVESASRLIGRSVQATNEAVRTLTAAQVLKQTTTGRRNRLFEAPELINAFNALERQLASPAANTAVSPPSRSVPASPRA